MRTVGEELVAGLAARGVDCVFGIPGVHTIELYRGLAGSGIRHVTARHEQGAAFMADGYARVSGRPGVAFVVTGPGVTNALTGIGQARADSVPILVVSSVNRRDSLGKGLGLLHELPDQAALVRTLCPTFRISEPADLGPVLDAAFAAMLSGRPGPAHIDVPTDVLAMAAPPLPPPAARSSAGPDQAACAEAMRLLSASQAPLILAGGGCRWAEAALQRLAEALDAPVVQTINARGLMHGHRLTVPASPSLDAVRHLVTGSDMVLAVGTELGLTDLDLNAEGGVPDLSGIIRIDVSAAQLDQRPCRLAICGRAEDALPLIVPPPRSGAGATRAAAARSAARAELADDMHPQLAVVEALRDAMPGALIVGDSTQPVYAGNLYFDAPFPGSWFNASCGYGTLGYAPGAAVGAAMASDRPVICLIGDGGLQFSPGELRTAVDEGLDVTFAVWNNAGYREIAMAMQGAGAPVIGCDPSPLRLEPFAAACDLPYARVTADPAEVAAAIAGGRGPRLIEIVAP
ncbi:MAG: 5-guanidino-2-oxopentanoate decarboxylase [Gemmobacter sp.]